MLRNLKAQIEKHEIAHGRSNGLRRRFNDLVLRGGDNWVCQRDNENCFHARQKDGETQYLLVMSASNGRFIQFYDEKYAEKFSDDKSKTDHQLWWCAINKDGKWANRQMFGKNDKSEYVESEDKNKPFQFPTLDPSNPSNWH